MPATPADPKAAKKAAKLEEKRRKQDAVKQAKADKLAQKQAAAEAKKAGGSSRGFFGIGGSKLGHD